MLPCPISRSILYCPMQEPTIDVSLTALSPSQSTTEAEADAAHRRQVRYATCGTDLALGLTTEPATPPGHTIPADLRTLRVRYRLTRIDAVPIRRPLIHVACHVQHTE